MKRQTTGLDSQGVLPVCGPNGRTRTAVRLYVEMLAYLGRSSPNHPPSSIHPNLNRAEVLTSGSKDSRMKFIEGSYCNARPSRQGCCSTNGPFQLTLDCFWNSPEVGSDRVSGASHKWCACRSARAGTQAPRLISQHELTALRPRLTQARSMSSKPWMLAHMSPKSKVGGSEVP